MNNKSSIVEYSKDMISDQSIADIMCDFPEKYDPIKIECINSFFRKSGKRMNLKIIENSIHFKLLVLEVYGIGIFKKINYTNTHKNCYVFIADNKIKALKINTCKKEFKKVSSLFLPFILSYGKGIDNVLRLVGDHPDLVKWAVLYLDNK